MKEEQGITPDHTNVANKADIYLPGKESSVHIVGTGFLALRLVAILLAIKFRTK